MTTMTIIFTAADKLACLERELRYRESVYPRRIANGTMTEKLAKRQIALIEAIIEDYRKAAQRERLL